MSEKENSGEGIQKKFDLQERFIDYAVRIIKVSEQLPDTKAVRQLADQILRSGYDESVFTPLRPDKKAK